MSTPRIHKKRAMAVAKSNVSKTTILILLTQSSQQITATELKQLYGDT